MTEILPVISEDNQSQLPAKAESGLQPLELENIAALHSAEAAPFDLMGDYWSPEKPLESRRVLFDRIQAMDVVDQQTGEVVELNCAYFFYQEQPNGPIKQIRNGSKRLVGALEAYKIRPRTPLLIQYLGKKRNKNNSNMSDNWSITPLIINVSDK